MEGAPPPPFPPLLLPEDELPELDELLEDDELLEEELLEEEELLDDEELLEDELELLLEDELEPTVPMESVADKLVALGFTPFETTQRNWSPTINAATLATFKVLVVVPE